MPVFSAAHSEAREDVVGDEAKREKIQSASVDPLVTEKIPLAQLLPFVSGGGLRLEGLSVRVNAAAVTTEIIGSKNSKLLGSCSLFRPNAAQNEPRKFCGDSMLQTTSENKSDSQPHTQRGDDFGPLLPSLVEEEGDGEHESEVAVHFEEHSRGSSSASRGRPTTTTCRVGGGTRPPLAAALLAGPAASGQHTKVDELAGTFGSASTTVHVQPHAPQTTLSKSGSGLESILTCSPFGEGRYGQYGGNHEDSVQFDRGSATSPFPRTYTPFEGLAQRENPSISASPQLIGVPSLSGRPGSGPQSHADRAVSSPNSQNPVLNVALRLMSGRRQQKSSQHPRACTVKHNTVDNAIFPSATANTNSEAQAEEPVHVRSTGVEGKAETKGRNNAKRSVLDGLYLDPEDFADGHCLSNVLGAISYAIHRTTAHGSLYADAVRRLYAVDTPKRSHKNKIPLEKLFRCLAKPNVVHEGFALEFLIVEEGQEGERYPPDGGCDVLRAPAYRLSKKTPSLQSAFFSYEAEVALAKASRQAKAAAKGFSFVEAPEGAEHNACASLLVCLCVHKMLFSEPNNKSAQEVGGDGQSDSVPRDVSESDARASQSRLIEIVNTTSVFEQDGSSASNHRKDRAAQEEASELLLTKEASHGMIPNNNNRVVEEIGWSALRLDWDYVRKLAQEEESAVPMLPLMSPDEVLAFSGRGNAANGLEHSRGSSSSSFSSSTNSTSSSLGTSASSFSSSSSRFSDAEGILSSNKKLQSSRQRFLGNNSRRVLLARSMPQHSTNDSGELAPPFAGMSYPTLDGPDTGFIQMLGRSLHPVFVLNRLRLPSTLALLVVMLALSSAVMHLMTAKFDACCVPTPDLSDTADVKKLCVSNLTITSGGATGTGTSEVLLAQCEEDMCFGKKGRLSESLPSAFLWGMPLSPGRIMAIVIALTIVTLFLTMLVSFFATRPVAVGSANPRFFVVPYLLQLAAGGLLVAGCVATAIDFFEPNHVVDNCDVYGESSQLAALCRSEYDNCGVRFVVSFSGVAGKDALPWLCVLLAAFAMLQLAFSLIPPLLSPSSREALEPAIPDTMIFKVGRYAPDGITDDEVAALQKAIRAQWRRERFRRMVKAAAEEYSATELAGRDQFVGRGVTAKDATANLRRSTEAGGKGRTLANRRLIRAAQLLMGVHRLRKAGKGADEQGLSLGTVVRFHYPDPNNAAFSPALTPAMTDAVEAISEKVLTRIRSKARAAAAGSPTTVNKTLAVLNRLSSHPLTDAEQEQKRRPPFHNYRKQRGMVPTESGHFFVPIGSPTQPNSEARLSAGGVGASDNVKSESVWDVLTRTVREVLNEEEKTNKTNRQTNRSRNALPLDAKNPWADPTGYARTVRSLDADKVEAHVMGIDGLGSATFQAKVVDYIAARLARDALLEQSTLPHPEAMRESFSPSVTAEGDTRRTPAEQQSKSSIYPGWLHGAPTTIR